MKIAILAPVWFPVPPSGYGGIEWVVWLLADGLAGAGHDVTLFAAGESRTKARLAYVYRRAPSEMIGRTEQDLRHALNCLSRQDEFELVNDHSGMLAAAIGGGGRVPMAHTVHGPLGGMPGEMYEQISRVAPNVGFISISMNQRRPDPDLNWIGNCPNALDFDLYPFGPESKKDGGDYLLFLGRMTADKGAHRAVRTAVETGLPLKLAGKMREPLEQQYFDEYVRPHLNSRIEYLGEVSHGEKVELLQHARATLFPINWEEPFGLVMIESMACGTPVVATRRGAVPEVIEPGRGGVIVDDWRDAPRALEEATAIAPATCRAYAEEHFSPERMLSDYLQAYETLLAQ
jgi:glycosyltransferase involved in cell wall biosynthesis